ncbi:unnamed protein product [Arctia plantaginis]|uniref:Uncharacterized protein n=1 Tax=Arctia plantaginis TaxID=874455 RepID=A0A8S0ZCZ7_ARCPL|nr:unnamed protein product [Arctia plantaginis]
MLVESYRVNQMDSDKQMKPRRDYRPNKWLTNSAMDIWYGNKTFIDIVWREFSDLMYKLTERDDRSINFEEYHPNEVEETTTHPFTDEIIKVDIRLSNSTNETTYTIYYDHPSNLTMFKSIT